MGSGEWLLFYIGTTRDEPSAVCNRSGLLSEPLAASKFTDALMPHAGSGIAPEALAQRIGLATAVSPQGPWTRRKQPIVEPGHAGAWDDLFTVDMAPYIFPNNSVLLIYKARSREKPGMFHGVAFADHWTQPFRKLTQH